MDPSPSYRQGSEAWRQVRCGRITASRFAEVMTEPRSKAAREAGELSETARAYLAELLVERLTGRPLDIAVTPAMQWGLDWEGHARAVYADRQGIDVVVPPFCFHADKPGIGCSPDGLVGDVGGIELKCPYGQAEHMRTLLSGSMPAKHMAQVQGSMWVTGREWWDYGSYDPRLEDLRHALFVTRVHRDDRFIGQLDRACDRLLTHLDASFRRLTKGEAPECAPHAFAHLLAPPIVLRCGGELIPIGKEAR